MANKREIYYIESEPAGGVDLTPPPLLTHGNQTWFKLLALISFTSALFVCAALIWLIVCRPSRLPVTDSQIKRDALTSERARRRRRSCWSREKTKFRRRLRYLIFGKVKIQSPKFTSSSDPETAELINANKQQITKPTRTNLNNVTLNKEKKDLKKK